jgi:cytochrome c biogenesis protein CcmG/thiol:disulfide interchange protein DsbE
MFIPVFLVLQDPIQHNMKYIITLLLLIPTLSYSQAKEKGRDFPITQLKTLDGQTISTSDFQNDGKPIIVSFWATWCKPCVNELTNMAEVYDEWKEKTGVKIIAISIDDARNMTKVAPFVNGKGWDYEVYLDPNSDLKRALNINLIPHTFLLNANKQIVWQHNSYTEGDELKLFELVKQLSEGKTIAE